MDKSQISTEDQLREAIKMCSKLTKVVDHLLLGYDQPTSGILEKLNDSPEWLLDEIAKVSDDEEVEKEKENYSWLYW